MKRYVKALLALSIALYASPAGAEEFVGILVGPSFVNRGLGLKLGFGFETAGKLDPHWSLGFLFNFSSLGTTNGSPDSATLTTFLGGVTYHGWENNRGPWAGLRAGVGVINNSNSIDGFGVVGGSSNSFAAGLALGYDRHLGEEWTWGPQGQVILVKNDAGNLMTFNVMLSLRYWPN